MPGQIVEMDPAAIGFIQFPEWHKVRPGAAVSDQGWISGDWDAISEKACFWGARYEGGRGQSTAMVPLENYHFLTALREHFHHGKDWRETAWYAWMVAKGPSRYNAEDKVIRRLRFLDQLYADCLAGRYRMDAKDPPLVNIGREGRIALDDGRHRICVAKVAGLGRITVKINVVHNDLKPK
ncbi:hypothetical protein [Roseobacter weihaiensis]|uniref:hypothetical protein n=1 Tax=Roseobacter weihaiensis TaxID=2763262 RepID=UPI001D0AA496|nr:hypothetical protein [Roseobacter sp. H9]